MLNITLKQITSFWSKVIRINNYDCWVCTLYKDKKGYTSVNLRSKGKRKSMLSHRLAWVIVKGDIPNGLCVCHKCDNPSCVNPDHLFLGTYLDNVKDKMLKGRHYSGLTNPIKKAAILASANSNIAISKKKKTFKEIKHQQKESNSQYGTFWITNGFENKKWGGCLG